MSSTSTSRHHQVTVERRVRHQAQDVVAVMAFSGLLSVACAVALLLLTQLGH